MFNINNHRYNRLANAVRSLAAKLKELNPKDPFRINSTTQLLEKLYGGKTLDLVLLEIRCFLLSYRIVLLSSVSCLRGMYGRWDTVGCPAFCCLRTSMSGNIYPAMN